MTKNEILIKGIKKTGLSITMPRLIIFDILSCDKHYHSVPEIQLEALKKYETKLNTKSIYNTLKKFMDKGLIDEAIHNGIAVFAIKHNSNNKVHVIYKNKIKHIELSEASISEINAKIGSKTIEEIHIKIK